MRRPLLKVYPGGCEIKMNMKFLKAASFVLFLSFVFSSFVFILLMKYDVFIWLISAPVVVLVGIPILIVAAENKNTLLWGAILGSVGGSVVSIAYAMYFMAERLS